MPFLVFKRRLAETLESVINDTQVTSEWLFNSFEIPPTNDLGHLALPCFKLSKMLKTGTPEISKKILNTFKLDGCEVKAAGPYVNFRWDFKSCFKSTLKEILEKGDEYGTDSIGKNRSIVLEFCSPNIAKHLFFHHIRTTLIGSALSNVYRTLGFSVETINFIGDWGAQFTRLLAAYTLWGKQELLSSDSAMDHLYELYVRFHKEVDQHPEYVTLSNEILKKIEANDEKLMVLWKKIREISLTSMEKTLSRFHVVFNHVDGESQYIYDMAKALPDIKQKANAVLSDGAWIVELEDVSTPALIEKKDGTSLYLTRDILAAIDRHQRFQFEKAFYVVSEQQRLHFQQLFSVLKKMGFKWSEKLEHLSFGTVLLGAEKMSSREGNVVILDHVIREAVERALKACTEKNPDLVDKEKISEAVGIGALIFGTLSSYRMRGIEFNWESVLSFDGETGPYVQYSGVRCHSLLKKVGAIDKNDSCAGYSFSQEEEELVLYLSKFRSALHRVIAENEPFHLTQYLLDLTKSFNRFYYKLPVLQATGADEKRIRTLLVWGTREVLKNGLSLLGMTLPEEM